MLTTMIQNIPQVLIPIKRRHGSDETLIAVMTLTEPVEHSLDDGLSWHVDEIFSK